MLIRLVISRGSTRENGFTPPSRSPLPKRVYPCLPLKIFRQAAAWRERMNLTDIPVLTLPEAGARLAALSKDYDFAFFEYWLSDYAGHGQDMDDAHTLLANLDAVLGGLLAAWDDENLILVTSDHGNLEDLSTRRHTPNPVPLLLVGNPAARQAFGELRDLLGITPALRKILL
jgi:2,3-bisphosphoglycerate-independent phosphoglycerate mutase